MGVRGGLGLPKMYMRVQAGQAAGRLARRGMAGRDEMGWARDGGGFVRKPYGNGNLDRITAAATAALEPEMALPLSPTTECPHGRALLRVFLRVLPNLSSSPQGGECYLSCPVLF